MRPIVYLLFHKLHNEQIPCHFFFTLFFVIDESVRLCGVLMQSIIYLQGIAKSVGNWYFNRVNIKAIDCPYPCDKSCHNLVFR